jgi:hypothetical protein
MPVVKVRALLCDSVQSVEGKLYVLGAGWNRLAAGGFPARHDRVGIGVLITIEDGDRGEHNLELSLLDPHDQPMVLFVDPSGAEQFAIHATFEAQPPADGFGEVAVPLAVNLDGLSFPEAGAFAFSFRVDGTERERLAFRVDQVADGPDAVPTEGTTTARGAAEAGYL